MLTEPMALSADHTLKLEQAWCKFIATLQPWARHWVFERELALHDEFMEGSISILTVAHQLRDEFGPGYTR